MNNKNESRYYSLLGSIGIMTITIISVFYLPSFTSVNVKVAVYVIAFIVIALSAGNLIMITKSLTEIKEMKNGEKSEVPLITHQEASLIEGKEKETSPNEKISPEERLLEAIFGDPKRKGESHIEQEEDQGIDKILLDSQLTSFIIRSIVRDDPSFIQKLINQYNELRGYIDDKDKGTVKFE